jgi:hypothetical protein
MVKKRKKEEEKILKEIDWYDAAYVCTQKMPRGMSEWFDERISSGQYANVVVKDGNRVMYGKAMKSKDCTVILFPNNNCASQFKEIVNALRKEAT